MTIDFTSTRKALAFPSAALFVASLLATASPANAQDIAAAAVQASQPMPGTNSAVFLERLKVAHQYLGINQRVKASLFPPVWMPEGDRFIHWAASGPHANTWVMVDAANGTQKPVLASAELKSQLQQILGGNVSLPSSLNFALTPDRNGIVFQMQGRPFRLGLDDRRVTALTVEDPQGHVALGAAMSPDRGSIALVKQGGFAVMDPSGRTSVERGGERYYNWQLPPGAWSPNGHHLFVSRTDERHVHKIPVVDYKTPLEQVSMEPYVKSGTPLAKPEHYVVEPGTGKVTRLSLPEEETYDFFAGWRPDGSEALILRLSRDGKKLDLYAVQPGSATSRLVLREERPESFIGALDFAAFGSASQVTPLEDGSGFLWASERDGWRNLYQYDYQGTLKRQVTKGKFVVHDVLDTTPAGEIYFIASEDGEAPYDRLLYRTNLKGPAPKRLSTRGGIHQVSFSPSGKYYVDSHSSRSTPRISEIVAAGTGKAMPFAKAEVSTLAELNYSPPESITALAADGITTLHGVLYKPNNFDPSKRYPVLNYVYAGPWLAVVPWHYVGSLMAPGGSMAHEAQAMAQLGFVVVLLDARGTPGRGKEFQDVNYGKIGETEIPDQVAAVRQAAAARPYMDLSRVGIFGHSWGGYYALRGMVTAPDFYKAGYAGAPGALGEEAIINEPNLGLTSQNRKAYEAGANEPLAGNLKGALKMMHGTSDVNASLSTTMRMSEALIKAGKHFDQLIMPGQPHGTIPPANIYYFNDRMLFFWKHLGGPQ